MSEAFTIIVLSTQKRSLFTAGWRKWITHPLVSGARVWDKAPLYEGGA